MSPSPLALPPLTLVIGGARSGKSRYAETLLRRSGCARVYIATAEAWDDEMRARIRSHVQDRGPDWITIEAPHDLAGALAHVGEGQAVLVDCATLWLTNRMLAEADLAAETATLLAALRVCPAPVVVVSNEVGWSIVPENALARAFRDAQGRLNQHLAAEADLAVAVMAGLPLALRGQLP
ncbi:MAG: bifunctional adenosylcobinamide kinase/adenosylcobinamide-phosphate guanylyltransferase [Gemmobacter sp.]|uniref:bifunctional adenosylcobinamide kinase/adenosylcobinamide-phosphate guanylyltransferase n=1 Tax=Gemmobacter sp. TaxID=1898957 RepID=UPI001A61D008|nr:bifunctional adenosylcobinamide kinase/adenosylcobinamide-phosphate guanylyltransferase [Gemmobacter sp.]MBL8560704.1 bifunctional adenosylcobinamide kinase/adenosylcobinamide-phosphate guanylyltransferase [Gemmobacter sp.]